MKSLSLIGMCKNAGKTTVLNALIKSYENSQLTLGLTSIGRDGEDCDIVTGTSKPRIYVKRHTVFATTAALLKSCDVTKEILWTTGMNTPLGEVVIIRALSDGFIQLSGPSMNSQIVSILEIFERFGVGLAIVDGAFGRKTMAAPYVTEQTILCTGASLNKNMRSVIEQTMHIHNLLQTPIAEPELMSKDGLLEISAISEHFKIPPDTRVVYLPGVVTDNFIQSLITQGIKNISLVAADASKLMINAENYAKLQIRHIGIFVVKKTHLLAITVNPFSAYGYSFDPEEFLARMQEASGVPVFDVMKGAGLHDFFN